MSQSATTQLLIRAREGDGSAADGLLSAVYRELRDMAGAMMANERRDHTLQPTALVHEAWMKLIAEEARGGFENRRHFLRVAARAMRQVLVDHARARQRDKRGGARPLASFDLVLDELASKDVDVVALDDALARLGALDEELQRVVELRFFAGLTIGETAEVLVRSTPTVERAWRMARAWLRTELSARGA